MEWSSSTKRPRRRITAGVIFVLLISVGLFPGPVRGGSICLSMPECAQERLSLESPEYLAPTPPPEEKSGESAATTPVIPFIGSNPALTLLPLPQRPAITASDTLPGELPEVTAGIKVDLGTVKFNLGYTLPSGQVDDFVRPIGVELKPGEDSKRFSLGVKIPF